MFLVAEDGQGFCRQVPRRGAGRSRRRDGDLREAGGTSRRNAGSDAEEVQARGAGRGGKKDLRLRCLRLRIHRRPRRRAGGLRLSRLRPAEKGFPTESVILLSVWIFKSLLRVV